ncbi:MAG: hypothetical protein ACYS5F_11530 [Planctomycetota bacterium]|jgi:hypothetical protein
MAERIIVHCVEVEDKAGSLQALLAKAAEAGVDFQGTGGMCRGCRNRSERNGWIHYSR